MSNPNSTFSIDIWVYHNSSFRTLEYRSIDGAREQIEKSTVGWEEYFSDMHALRDYQAWKEVWFQIHEEPLKGYDVEQRIVQLWLSHHKNVSKEERPNIGVLFY